MFVLLFFVVATCPAWADQPVAFTGVNVIPMDSERVLENRTVVVDTGSIQRIGPAEEVEPPDGATLVEADGKYLMPGLSEMHAHVPDGGNRQYLEDVLFLYLANGVTLARGMIGDPSHIELRRDLATGDVAGPRLIVGGRWLGGGFDSPADAAQVVRQQKEMGYDFLKMGEGQSPEIFKGIVKQAHASSIDMAGHVSGQVGLKAALEAGYATVDHLDDYMQELVDPDEAPDVNPGFFGYRLAPYARQERMEQIARETREAGVWNVPTETIMHSTFTLDFDEVRERRRDEFRYMPEQVVEGWFESRKNFRASKDYDPEAGKEFLRVRLDLIEALHEEGAGLLLGSDAPQWFNVPGFSLHHEIEAMGESGLTPYEILRTGTVNPAIFLGEEDAFGRVEEGMVADLILLNANPLEDLSNTRKIEGVMRHGRWYDRQQIDARLEAIDERYQHD